MKVLITLTPAFNPSSGGVQRITFNLGKFFSEKGLNVIYFSFSDAGHIQPQHGKLYHSLQPGGTKHPENIKHLRSTIDAEKPDVVMNQMPYEPELRETLSQCKKRHGYLLAGCLMNSLFNFKSNARDVTQRSTNPLLFKFIDNALGMRVIQFRHWLRHRKDLKLILEQHDYFVLVAPPSEDELNYFVGNYHKEKRIVIPNSIPKIYSGNLQKEKIILHVGRLNVPQKRSDLLLEFWQRVYPSLPDWKFIILGDGPHREKMEQEIAKLAIPRVSMEGFQQPESFYKRASVFMMPSAFEGFPNVLLEAQSFAAVPVAFDSYKALSWIVNDRHDGILIRPFDTSEMAKEVIKLVKDPARLKAMSETCRINAHRFTIDKVGQQWLDFFNANKPR